MLERFKFPNKIRSNQYVGTEWIRHTGHKRRRSITTTCPHVHNTQLLSAALYKYPYPVEPVLNSSSFIKPDDFKIPGGDMDAGGV